MGIIVMLPVVLPVLACIFLRRSRNSDRRVSLQTDFVSKTIDDVLMTSEIYIGIIPTLRYHDVYHTMSLNRERTQKFANEAEMIV